MRSYIFTPKEREIIDRFFEGRVKAGDEVIRQTIRRLRSFDDLAGDVELYLKLREAVATSST